MCVRVGCVNSIVQFGLYTRINDNVIKIQDTLNLVGRMMTVNRV